MILHAIGKQKKAGVVAYLDKINFKPKQVTRGERRPLYNDSRTNSVL